MAVRDVQLKHKSLKSWNEIWHTGGMNWSQWLVSSCLLDLQLVHRSLKHTQSDNCEKQSLTRKVTDHLYLCKESFSLTDALDMTCSLQTSCQCSWEDSAYEVMSNAELTQVFSIKIKVKQRITLYGKCRGRAGERWCLLAAARPGRSHIHPRPSSGRPLEDTRTSQVLKQLQFRWRSDVCSN